MKLEWEIPEWAKVVIEVVVLAVAIGVGILLYWIDSFYSYLYTFFALLALTAWLLLKSLRYKTKDNIEKSKNIAEILAITAAAFFFIFRLFDGWMSVNLSVNMKADRILYDDQKNEDLIAVQVDIEKGEVGTIRLYDAEIRAIFPDETDETKKIGIPVKLLAIQRLEQEGGIIQSEKIAAKNYRITPAINCTFRTI